MRIGCVDIWHPIWELFSLHMLRSIKPIQHIICNVFQLLFSNQLEGLPSDFWGESIQTKENFLREGVVQLLACSSCDELDDLTIGLLNFGEATILIDDPHPHQREDYSKDEPLNL